MENGTHSRRFQTKSRRAQNRSQNVTSFVRDFEFSNGDEGRPVTAANLRQRQSYRVPVNPPEQRTINDYLCNRYGVSDHQTQRRRRTLHRFSPSPVQRKGVGFQGHRGAPSLHWRSGLRESTHTSDRYEEKTVSLFVDNIPKGVDRSWFRRVFEDCGKVRDVFISSKTRKNRKDGFGFVRYSTIHEAEQAIQRLHNYVVRGRKLWVSMAKYGKDGAAVKEGNFNLQKQNGKAPDAINRRKQRSWDAKATINSNPAYRDGRRYSDVVVGVRKQKVDNNEVSREKVRVIPVTHTFNVNEDARIASMLKLAIIAENSEVINVSHIQSKISSCEINETGMFSLSPTKLLIVFECEMDATNAVEIDSPLWNVFDNIRLWSEGEFFDDRLVWIDCIGIHPLCCSKENLKTIGELWGPVIHIEKQVQGIESITGARLLIRTKAQNKIDNRIKLLYDHGSCDVWVKEYQGSCTKYCGNRNVKMSQSKTEHNEVLKQGTLDYPLHYVMAPFEDPLVQVMKERDMDEECRLWEDPIIANENIDWSDIESDDSCSHQDLITPIMSPSREVKSSRPRGRPKKSSDRGLIEARKTWETAQRLGITVDDENAVVSSLRKSKRILILEDKGE